MLWVSFLLLAVLAIAPVVVSFRRKGAEQGKQQAAIRLHRAQLVELDRERVEGRIGPTEHAAAVLEVNRRLLAIGAEQEIAPRARIGWGVLAPVLIAIPLVAFALYLPGGDPGLPAAPLAPRLAAEHRQQVELAKLVIELRQRLAGLEPKSEQAREGLLLLGRAEAELGNFSAAAKAWRQALDDRFDPALAAAAGEAETRAAGFVDPEAVALFRSALENAPTDAPWRALAEQRLAEAGRR